MPDTPQLSKKDSWPSSSDIVKEWAEAYDYGEQVMGERLMRDLEEFRRKNQSLPQDNPKRKPATRIAP